MGLHGCSKWGHYLAFSLLLQMSLQSTDTHNKSTVLPGCDFKTMFMPAPASARAWAWAISVVFLDCLGTNSMSGTLLNVSRAIKGTKWGESRDLMNGDQEFKMLL